MKIQLLSDLHLESEDFVPSPLPDADLLVLAGDIDARWTGYGQFANWPVPVLVVAGNHEFDGREIDTARPALQAHCQSLGLTLLEKQRFVWTAPDGRRVRFVGTTRWSDFDLFGPAGRERAERAAGYFQRVMGATLQGQPFDAAAVRREGLACRQWLESELALTAAAGSAGWDRTVVLTHFAPSLRSADPRYGKQPGTASFCNADDDLIARCDLWLHGHLHCRHDYAVPRPGRRPARVVCQARGLAKRQEAEGYDAGKLITLD